MGIVHAKERESRNQSPQNEAESSGKHEILLEGLPVRVDRIHINGLARTKDDIVRTTVRELFKATDMQDVILRVHKVRDKLDSLGCFKNIGVLIDTSTGENASKDGLDITFNVREVKRMAGSINTSVGNNEGSVVFGMRLPNILGRGEKIQAEYGYGTKKSNNFNLQFIKPLIGRMDAVLTTTLYQQMSDWPWSGYRQLDRGLLCDLGFNSTPLVKHNLQWDAAIRDLSVLTRASAFAVREEAGLSLKSALRHVLSVDQRDEGVFPSMGSLVQLTTELSGFGGDIGYLKNELYVQANYSIMEDLVIQGTLQGGFLNPTSVDKKISMCDQFYVGGPLTLRGFQMRGVGPHSDGNSMGSDMYMAGGLHLYTPLPFRIGKGGFGELFRTHMFATAGNVGQMSKLKADSWEHFTNDLRDTMRVSYGIGVALRVGSRARLEVNYCVPYLYQKGDQVQPGVQFGVGLQFL